MNKEELLYALRDNKGWVVADEAASLIEHQDEAIRVLREALALVRGIITEGAAVGFNYADGDWPQRLYESQAATYKALAQTKEFGE